MVYSIPLQKVVRQIKPNLSNFSHDEITECHIHKANTIPSLLKANKILHIFLLLELNVSVLTECFNFNQECAERLVKRGIQLGLCVVYVQNCFLRTKHLQGDQDCHPAKTP